ncbi:MAG: hypothetical protein ACOC2B_05025, partial [Sediminispirochaetaceae bacterium]
MRTSSTPVYIFLFIGLLLLWGCTGIPEEEKAEEPPREEPGAEPPELSMQPYESMSAAMAAGRPDEAVAE